MTALWQEIKDYISSVLPKNTFSLWIDPIIFLEKKGKTIILGCPNKFSRNWVVENYLGLIEDKFNDAGAGHLDLVFRVQAPKRENSGSRHSADPQQLTLTNLPSKTGQPVPLFFNRDYTFDRFIVGRCNEFAYSASKAVAQGGSWDFSTLLCSQTRDWAKPTSPMQWDMRFWNKTRKAESIILRLSSSPMR